MPGTGVAGGFWLRFRFGPLYTFSSATSASTTHPHARTVFLDDLGLAYWTYRTTAPTLTKLSGPPRSSPHRLRTKAFNRPFICTSQPDTLRPHRSPLLLPRRPLLCVNSSCDPPLLTLPRNLRLRHTIALGCIASLACHDPMDRPVFLLRLESHHGTHTRSYHRAV